MAYFHCLIGGGGSGGGYELTVTCDADFAGTTITCTDGVTTLTQTCPSASPYEVVFEIPNGGDWTISGVTGGQTVSTGVNIPTSANLNARIRQTVTIHSAKEDTISYTDIDGATQTITFASGETSKQVQITIEPSGNSFTFTSSVAKNPDNLSQYYSKTFTVTTSTTELYLMPDGALYWYGNTCDWLTGGLDKSLWQNGNTSSYTLNTNDYAYLSNSNYPYQPIYYYKNNITCSGYNTIKTIAKDGGFNRARVGVFASKSTNTMSAQSSATIGSSYALYSTDVSSYQSSYPNLGTYGNSVTLNIQALWLE